MQEGMEARSLPDVNIVLNVTVILFVYFTDGERLFDELKKANQNGEY